MKCRLRVPPEQEATFGSKEPSLESRTGCCSWERGGCWAGSGLLWATPASAMAFEKPSRFLQIEVWGSGGCSARMSCHKGARSWEHEQGKEKLIVCPELEPWVSLSPLRHRHRLGLPKSKVFLLPLPSKPPRETLWTTSMDVVHTCYQRCWASLLQEYQLLRSWELLNGQCSGNHQPSHLIGSGISFCQVTYSLRGLTEFSFFSSHQLISRKTNLL